MHPAPLPAPDPEALAAARRLLERIGAELAAGGNWISFARYMELALYEPGLGYYAGGAAKLGAPGDFVTAPEMGGLFARTLARQVAELLEPGDAILEFGAGSGALAATLIDELAALGAGGHEYLILEPSAELAGRQRARLDARVRWLGALPQDFRGVMLANEVLDAMPVHALVWTGAGVLERGVCAREGRLAWSERPAQGEVLATAREIALELPPPGRYESELGLAARAWMRTLGAHLERGALLAIDYGFPRREYYHPQRSMGTLQCHYRHRSHGDVFHYPGLQDITAHIDFSALAEAALESGLELLGYAPQAQFLLNCGLTELLSAADPEDIARYAPLAAEAQRLVSPAEMGELFKVLAVGRGVRAGLRGFARGDRRHAL
ncbi:MAG TPA: SAM-dependent methyltransferase [Burkholderiales bacterium]|nr:SAM-dependent methyltransferase [Burkholderiales bacterium]